MHEAQFEYDTFDARADLDQINNPAPPTPFEYPKPPASIEFLMHMQKAREAVQAQLDRMEASLDDDALPPMMRPIMEATMLGPMRSQLERYDEEISDIQKRLENPE